MPQSTCLGQYVSIKPVVLGALLNTSVLLRWSLLTAGAVEQPCGAITLHWTSGQTGALAEVPRALRFAAAGLDGIGPTLGTSGSGRTAVTIRSAFVGQKLGQPALVPTNDTLE